MAQQGRKQKDFRVKTLCVVGFGAIFLNLELNAAYEGMLEISSTPLRAIPPQFRYWALAALRLKLSYL